MRALYPDRAAFVDRLGTGPTTLSGLRAVLSEARQRGYAVEDGEVSAGPASVAAPVLDHNGHPVASVALTFANGTALDTVAGAVQTTASALSKRLGG
ncbi:IclR family transcriptional regulator domain-containing protein [Nocardioides sp. B-3]|uniref:IclR family transcriptional regulator domain-containing protein n=1 Tax=Nocardioides sp. B-3 TaxID=2895565 RepID=UPI0021539E62|nr:IclR family transcriptional regulator C-terminal domain-containing protein [Nocardioides sp. B-3]UUZ61363.1 hypothetical protein LP418_12750 [Nocardioides sp. B-3]